jgi:hypothetical protein
MAIINRLGLLSWSAESGRSHEKRMPLRFSQPSRTTGLGDISKHHGSNNKVHREYDRSQITAADSSEPNRGGCAVAADSKPTNWISDKRRRRRRKCRRQLAQVLLALTKRPPRKQHVRPCLDWDLEVKRLLLE